MHASTHAQWDTINGNRVQYFIYAHTDKHDYTVCVRDEFKYTLDIHIF